MFLPMSWTSPLTVAITTRPLLATPPTGGPLGLHERLEMGDGPLHHPGALDHLREEHLARAEQVTDRAHARHQRPFDDRDGAPVGEACLLGVLLDEIDDAVDQRVLEAPLHGLLAPGEVGAAPGALAADRLGEGQQALGGVGASIEDHVLGEVPQLRVQLVVDPELARVDDAHVHARGDGVVQERRVHRLADDVVAAEAEAEVRDPAGDLDARAGGLDLADRLEEVDRVARVLLDARPDGEDVGVEDDVLGRHTDLGRSAAGRRARRPPPGARASRPGRPRRRPSPRAPRRSAGRAGPAAGTPPRPP